MSKLKSIRVPAKTGVDKTTNMLVPSIAQQYIGSCISFRPGLLSLRMVAIKLIPPKMLESTAVESIKNSFRKISGFTQ